MIKKRGQVTVYVVLGIVIFFTLVVFGYLVFSGRVSIIEVSSSDFDEVKTHIESCIYQVLENGIRFYGNSQGVDYELNLENYITDYLPLCINFSMFNRVEVEAYKIDDVIVSLDDEKVKAKVVFPVTIRRGNDEKKFTYFYSEFVLKEKGCVNVHVDNNCKALESKTVKMMNLVLNYEPGDFVGVGGKCIAC
jgi:hypothetical protein